MANPGDGGPPAPDASVPATDDEPVSRAFMCVVSVEKPCPNAPIKYLCRLDGCSRGIHVTEYEAMYPQVDLYNRMAKAIKDFLDESPLQATSAPDSCSVCSDAIVPRQTSLMSYLEKCRHYFHDGCLMKWRAFQSGCDQCYNPSYRALLWPKHIPTHTKDELIQLQKRCFGLEVSPNASIQVEQSYVNGFPDYKICSNEKNVTLRKRPPPPSPPPPSPPRKLRGRKEKKRKEKVVPEPIQSSPVDDKNTKIEKERHRVVLRYYLCPILNCPDRNLGVTEDSTCVFWHRWPIRAPYKGTQRLPKLSHFPEYYCLHNALNPVVEQKHFECTESIRTYSNELARCYRGFHTIREDLSCLNGFADKMASFIMQPMVVPELKQDALHCALCKTGPELPNSIRVHLQSCAHWLHVDCLPRARALHSTNPNRTFDLLCPFCKSPSVRTLAWPGNFRSDMSKQAIFERQLKNFKLVMKADTKLTISEVANRVKVFTFDYGGPNPIDIDFSTVEDKSVIYYD